jgi:hypothetical protein
MTKFFGALFFGMICLAPTYVYAQSLLDKKISIEVSNQRLSDVLKMISNKGDFYFSYNTSIIKRDSLVSLSATNKSVSQILDQLFNNRYAWKQYNNHIIIRKVVVSPHIATQAPTPSADKIYTVSGYVLNGETGEKISNASIYEKQRLASTLTDEKGYFKIRLRSRYSTALLTISRELFEDTTVVIQPKYNQQLTIVMAPSTSNEPVVTISPVDIFQPDTIVVKPPADTLASLRAPVEEVNQVEKTKFGKFLLSTKQHIQSLNLKQFFADRTFQVSLTPGLSTHGRLSAQVVNHFSVNMIGGYTAGVNGIELGGAFNINKKDVRYLQAAGMMNIVGGSVTGVQLSGFHNNVLHDVSGVQAAGFTNFVRGKVSGVQMSGTHNHTTNTLTGIQAAGFSNYVKGKMTGLQISGFYNHASDSVTGLQAGAFANYARKKVTGAQLAGFANFANREMTGVQIAPVFNYAKRLKGLQVGLLNIADTSSGYSIGLINIILKGYHKIALYTNEVLQTNLAFKTGNSKLYSILLVGFNSGRDEQEKIFSGGYGLGHEFSLGKRFSINPEYTAQFLYLGSDSYTNFMNRLHLQFNIKFGKYFSIFGGPSFTMYYSDQPSKIEGYKFDIPSSSYHTFDLWGQNLKGWIGWNAGIAIF